MSSFLNYLSCPHQWGLLNCAIGTFSAAELENTVVLWRHKSGIHPPAATHTHTHFLTHTHRHSQTHTHSHTQISELYCNSVWFFDVCSVNYIICTMNWLLWVILIVIVWIVPLSMIYPVV